MDVAQLFIKPDVLLEDLAGTRYADRSSGGNNGGSNDLLKRAMKQLARELLLLESSDWPFLVTTGQAKDYAIERFNDHNERFQTLAKMISSGQLNEAKIAEMEDIDNCFPEIKPEDFALRVQAKV